VQERIYLLKDHSSISPLRVASAGLLYKVYHFYVVCQVSELPHQKSI